MKGRAIIVAPLLAILLTLASAFAQEITERDKLIFEMQNNYQREGLDVEVLYSASEKALILRSDLFKDIAMREQQIDLIARDNVWKKALCNVGLWYLQGGYSKGTFSRDVMKTVSLGCPAEKAALDQQHRAEREKFAASLQQDFNQGQDPVAKGTRVSAHGTTLVMESNLFAKPTDRAAFVRMFMADALVLQKLCGIRFSHLQVKGGGQARTVPLPCRSK